MKTAHTPGPWIIRKGDEWTHDIVTQHGELPDGSPSYWNVASANGKRFQVEANVRLIAAAPDLLAALEMMLAIHIAHHNDPIHVSARAAIAKATGGQS